MCEFFIEVSITIQREEKHTVKEIWYDYNKRNCSSEYEKIIFQQLDLSQLGSFVDYKEDPKIQSSTTNSL